ncbi:MULTISPECIES: DUF3011 domain-containing protein [unclassified Sphingopyxis]|uniref:DUF3011 domain-containing protein n=1 Tax=unclassified Sphingopyxis TaxID=2614943 RepID=UPI000731CD7F|nr:MULTISPECIES: DUF3011 domain-containing protein [unclassified Sphingopyxis]KTE26596.1 hypothetical protein ATE61_07705 [Sphingopyxis sp. H057]KTE53002.1 hypothetical protein ATE64_10150 [Sphingopyxis sp. H073]KTE55192.1 hypothetical protein ATE69_10125 [Sphingopyxis sp. H071]KTE58681.1 hypothetical protein ATE66_13955 [Sphingopyxis sp. H107]KTE64054.1 hypothetical protein ATE65_12840 [Sphingopyxis sp. H100]
MRNRVISVITAASFVTGQLAVPAFAQTTYPYPPPPGSGYNQGWAGTIRCESYGNRQQRCNVRTDNRVELTRVIGGRCSKGRDWGFDADGVWVSGGCRAEFRYGYAGGAYPGNDFAGTLRCESRSNRYEQCAVQTNGRVELVRKLGGKCNAGRQWGYGADYVWVTNGCRAEFGYGYANLAPLPGPKPDKDKGPSTGLIIGGIVVAGGLLALLASQKKKKADGTPEESAPPPASAGPAALSANLSGLPSAARPSVQNCMNDAARQIGATGGTKLSYDKLVSLEQGNGGWRIRAAMTATYPDGAKPIEMYCRATPSDIIQLDFN